MNPPFLQGKELYQLFGAYGTVTSCRLPKKSDYSGHRGAACVTSSRHVCNHRTFEGATESLGFQSSGLQ